MRARIAVVVVATSIAVVGSPAALSAQLPIHAGLQDATTIYLQSGPGFERDDLGHAAGEFRRQQRFELVASQSEADLIVTLHSGRDGTGAIVPVPGFGLLAGRYKVFYLEIADRETGESVWSDNREVHWSSRGAAIDLVKDLLAAVKEADRLKRIGR